MIKIPSTADAIVTYLKAASREQALSLGRAARQIRGWIPEAEITDEELTDLIASHALSMGFSVLLFDAKLRSDDDGQGLASPATCQNSSEYRSREAYNCIPKLRRAAAELTGDQEEADELVERALRRAIASVGNRPADGSLDDWLHELLGHVAAQRGCRPH